MRCKFIIMLVLALSACRVERHTVMPARFEVITQVGNLNDLNKVISVYTSLMGADLWVLGNGSLRGTIEKDSAFIAEKLRPVAGVKGMVIKRKTGR